MIINMKIYILTRSTMVLWILLGAVFICNAEKLSSGQRPPSHAKYSGGIALKTPLIGKRAAADVGSRLDVGRSGGGGPPARPQPPPQLPPSPKEEGVTREETEDLKIVDGKPVRVVKGRLAYSSPEGLPVAVKYEADENGNRASFTIGKATAGGSGGGSGGSGGGGGGGNRLNGGKSSGGGNKSGNGGGRKGGGGKTDDSTYLPPMNKNNNVDKSYLPPS